MYIYIYIYVHIRVDPIRYYFLESTPRTYVYQALHAG